MCEIIGETRRKSVIGWKIVYVISNGQYHSYYMEKPMITHKTEPKGVLKQIHPDFYEPKLRGRTTAFKKFSDAVQLFSHLDEFNSGMGFYRPLCIIKVKLISEVAKAKNKTTSTPYWAGREVKVIKEYDQPKITIPYKKEKR